MTREEEKREEIERRNKAEELKRMTEQLIQSIMNGEAAQRRLRFESKGK
jgi:hypothetical protein